MAIAMELGVAVRASESSIQYRYVFMLLGLTGLTCVYSMRVNLNVAIVSMVNHTAIKQSTKPSNCQPRTMPLNLSSSSSPPNLRSGSTLLNAALHSTFTSLNSTSTHSSPRARTDSGTKNGLFNWDPVTQGIVLGAFFWGYICSPLAGGLLAERYGGKWLFGFSLLITGLLGMLIPVVTMEFGYRGLTVLRALQGVSEGVSYPALHNMLSLWIPQRERSTAVGLVHIGGYLGVVVGMQVSGVLAASRFFGGWPSIFYLFGAVCIVWFVFWALLISDKPSLHPFISTEELSLILGDLGERKPAKGRPTPWKKILWTRSAWAAHIAIMGSMYMKTVLVTELPIYFGTVLNFDIKSNGLYSSLPYIGATAVSATSGPISDYLINHNIFSRTAVRRGLNTISKIGASILLCLVVPVAGCDEMLSLTFFVAAGSLYGASLTSSSSIFIDMAPDFVGSFFGVSVTLAALSGAIVPYVTGALTEYENTTTNWNHSFVLAAVVATICAIYFQCFAIAEVQSWGIIRTKNDAESNEVKNNDALSDSKTLSVRL